MNNETIYNKELAKRFRELREDAKLTQKQLASKLHISPVQVYNFEKARRRITEPTADLMSMIFNIDANYLLDETIEYKSVSEKYNSMFNKGSNDNYMMFKAICYLAEINGYTVEVKDISIDTINDLIEYMVFYKNGVKEFALSIDEANRFGNNLSDIFMANIRLKYTP